jgi:hypothetical protein
MDALGVYSKYLALNATNQVEVTDEIRQRVEGIYSYLETAAASIFTC